MSSFFLRFIKSEEFYYEILPSGQEGQPNTGKCLRKVAEPTEIATTCGFASAKSDSALSKLKLGCLFVFQELGETHLVYSFGGIH